MLRRTVVTSCSLSAVEIIEDIRRILVRSVIYINRIIRGYITFEVETKSTLFIHMDIKKLTQIFSRNSDFE